MVVYRTSTPATAPSGASVSAPIGPSTGSDQSDPVQRGLGWRSGPVIAFIAALVMLTTGAIISLLTPLPVLTGLPDDPEVAAARAALAPHCPIDAGDLRFGSTMGLETAPRPLTDQDRAAAGRAKRGFEAARQRRLNDPRLLAALGHIELSGFRLVTAERLYRRAVDLAAYYGEARIGLGVTLARQAALQGDPSRARALMLRAIAQFAAVNPRDPQYLPALFDRARLLARVGREAEARRIGALYLRRDPASDWATSLAAELGIAAP